MFVCLSAGFISSADKHPEIIAAPAPDLMDREAWMISGLHVYAATIRAPGDFLPIWRIRKSGTKEQMNGVK